MSCRVIFAAPKSIVSFNGDFVERRTVQSCTVRASTSTKIQDFRLLDLNVTLKLDHRVSSLIGVDENRKIMTCDLSDNFASA